MPSYVFHVDATIDNGHFKGSPEAFAAMVRERHARIPKSLHMIANVLIDFTRPHRAFVESYGLALEQHPGEGAGPDLDRVVRVRYADEFEERSGEWKWRAHRRHRPRTVAARI